MDWTPPTTFLVISDVRNATARLIVSDEPMVDAAVSRFTETGNDTLLFLTFVQGTEHRARCREFDALLAAEEEPGWKEAT